MGGKGDMTKTPSSLQDLSKSLYDKAKAEPTKRFWGLYVHVCKLETLQEAYEMAKKNDGHRESTGSRSRSSKRAERRVFCNRLETN
jgi:RNA-directed DNA polymerase